MTILSFTQRIIQISLAGGLALGLATLSGCGIGSSAPSSSGPVPFAVSGRVHGGQQPVSGSTIQLWSVGSTGYGSEGTNLLGSHVVTTGTDGSFSITGDYTCPTPDTLVYLLASGGNPGLAGGTNNTAIELAAPLGACGALSASTFVFIDEATTAATAVALGQYFTTTFGSASQDSFGTNNSTQGQTGLVNAFATANNLVDTTQGSARTSVTLTGAAGTITATPEAAKLNTIANILAACVNSDGSGTSPCQTTLFPDVTPTGKAPPTDTLQAAVYMSLNPISNNANGSAANLTALYGLQTPQSPFVGVASQPTDWTIGITYAAPVNTTNNLINVALDLKIDSKGNIWILNTPADNTLNSISELSPSGVPLVTALAGTGAPTGISAAGPRNIALDTNDDVYVASSSNSATVYEYNTTTAAVTSINLGSQAYGIAIDGSNNVFVSHNSGTTSSLEEFLGGTLASTSRVTYPFNRIDQFAVVDTSGAVYLSQGSTASSSVLQATGMNPGTCTAFPCTTANNASLVTTYTPITAGGINGPFAMAVTSNGVWVPNTAGNTATLITSSTAASNFGSTSNFNAPRYVAVDGSGNAWFSNRGSAAVTELSATGTVLSPVPAGVATSPIGFAHTGLSNGAGIAVDPSGNVWIANNTAAGVPATAGSNAVFEIVGAASPTVTPIALALKNFTVAAKP